VVRIIAQGQFDVNEENIGGAVFWPGYREHDGFFLQDEQLASLSGIEICIAILYYVHDLAVSLPCHFIMRKDYAWATILLDPERGGLTAEPIKEY
jgi:hypothetical protein